MTMLPKDIQEEVKEVVSELIYGGGGLDHDELKSLLREPYMVPFIVKKLGEHATDLETNPAYKNPDDQGWAPSEAARCRALIKRIQSLARTQ